VWNFFHPKGGYFLWSWIGTATIVAAVAFTVYLDTLINKWFGGFYDLLSKALSTPNSVSLNEYYGFMFEFFGIAGIYVIVTVIFNSFLVNHWSFRWRKSIADYFQDNWHRAHMIEGASQRQQEDCMKFSRLISDLSISLLESVLMLIAFIPILWGLSENVKEIPFIGEVDRGLVWISLMVSILGTGILSLVGAKLPGIEFKIQAREAAYRKILVLGEDDPSKADRPTVDKLFDEVKSIHFYSYLHYFYFSIAKFSWLQAGVLIPYVALAPTIVAGGITLGVVSQTVRAFGKVSESLTYIIRSWLNIVELISVWQRLSQYQSKFQAN
jgi:peptide/bleomycin uptake transporter